MKNNVLSVDGAGSCSSYRGLMFNLQAGWMGRWTIYITSFLGTSQENSGRPKWP